MRFGSGNILGVGRGALELLQVPRLGEVTVDGDDQDAPAPLLPRPGRAFVDRTGPRRSRVTGS